MRAFAPRAPHAGRRGLTLLEVMVAATIAAAFLAGVMTAFNQVLRLSGRAETTMRAMSNGRVALDAMVVEIKQANFFPGSFHFLGVNNPLPYGDGFDNNQDGRIDQEQADGQDTLGEWTPADDRHAEIAPGLHERPAFLGRPDLGDGRIDIDTVFNHDSIEFVIFPDPADPEPRDARIAFYIGNLEGRDHVLIKRVQTPANGPDPVVTESPLAEGALSLNALYWQPNGPEPYWVESWDSAGPETSLAPNIPLPAAVHLSLRIHADERPIETYRDGDPVRVEWLSTMTTIEQVIHDTRYPRP